MYLIIKKLQNLSLSLLMKVAIIGAGFSGLALCYHLLNSHGVYVTIFEANDIGSGASGASSGLLNPYFGEHGRCSDRAHEGMVAAKELLDLTEKWLGQPVYKQGIMHISANAKQVVSWGDHHTRFTDVRELTDTHYSNYFSLPQPRQLIESAMTVFPARYLQSLWQVCKSMGAKLVKQKIINSKEVSDYDQVVFAVGSSVKLFEECAHLPLKFVKGQSLYCKRPSDLPPLDYSVVAKGHVAISPDPDYFYLGSTYEHTFTDVKPNLAIAKEKIYSQVETYFPRGSKVDVVNCYSGIRVVSLKSYHPIVERVGSKHFVMTAMGSRGLLYHSLLGKELAQEIIRGMA